jgi:hypothetical protein
MVGRKQKLLSNKSPPSEISAALASHPCNGAMRKRAHKQTCKNFLTSSKGIWDTYQTGEQLADRSKQAEASAHNAAIVELHFSPVNPARS